LDKLIKMKKEEFIKLKIIKNEKGDLHHILKKSELTYQGFGEAYISKILLKQTKGWKKHLRMHMNLIVIQGEVEFRIKEEKSSKERIYRIGNTNYGRLYVPPGLWMSFTGLTIGENIIINIANIEHDINESLIDQIE